MKYYLTTLMGAVMLFSALSVSAQNVKKRPTNTGRSSSPNVGQSAVSVSNARLEACINKNRKLTTDLITLNNTISTLNTELSNANGSTSLLKSSSLAIRDSLVTIKALYKTLEEESKASLSIMSDSLASLRAFRETATQRMNQVVSDPNVVRVFDFPSDLVRIKMLRKFLEEGSGVVLEKNTDDGFMISKNFKDRVSKKGLFKKEVETKIESNLKLAIHPFNPDRTLFYHTIKLYERIGNKPFVEVSDATLANNYAQKLLRFYDTFLTK